MTVIFTIHSSWYVWPTSLIWSIVKWSWIFLEVSISLSCLFVHEPPYQTVVVCCNLVFAVVFSAWMTIPFCTHIGVGLAQAHPNYVINNYRQLCIYHYVAWVSIMPWIVKLQRLQSFHIRLTWSTISRKMNGTDCGQFILGWYGGPCHNE